MRSSVVFASTTYDSITGEVASVEASLARVVSFTHDDNSRMQTMTDAITTSTTASSKPSTRRVPAAPLTCGANTSTMWAAI